MIFVLLPIYPVFGSYMQYILGDGAMRIWFRVS
jgi:hypothetical protein